MTPRPKLSGDTVKNIKSLEEAKGARRCPALRLAKLGVITCEFNFRSHIARMHVEKGVDMKLTIQACLDVDPHLNRIETAIAGGRDAIYRRKEGRQWFATLDNLKFDPIEIPL